VNTVIIMIYIFFFFVQTNVLDSDDDEDIVDNPSVVDSKVGNSKTSLFFVNFFNFYYAFLGRFHRKLTFLFRLVYVRSVKERILFTPLMHFEKWLEIIITSVITIFQTYEETFYG
jgi:hypothetical protein